MGFAFLVILFALLLIGGVAAVAYGAAVAAGAAAGAVALVSLAVFGSLVALLFPLVVFVLMRAGFCPARARAHGHWSGGPRMRDEWHRTAHEPGTAGKAES